MFGWLTFAPIYRFEKATSGRQERLSFFEVFEQFFDLSAVDEAFNLLVPAFNVKPDASPT